MNMPIQSAMIKNYRKTMNIAMDYLSGVPNKAVSCDRHTPSADLPRSPQISMVTHSLPANRMFSGFKSLVNEWCLMSGGNEVWKILNK